MLERMLEARRKAIYYKNKKTQYLRMYERFGGDDKFYAALTFAKYHRKYAKQYELLKRMYYGY